MIDRGVWIMYVDRCLGKYIMYVFGYGLEWGGCKMFLDRIRGVWEGEKE